MPLKRSGRTNDSKRLSGNLLRACKLNRRPANVNSLASQIRLPLSFLLSSAFVAKRFCRETAQNKSQRNRPSSHPIRLCFGDWAMRWRYKHRPVPPMVESRYPFLPWQSFSNSSNVTTTTGPQETQDDRQLWTRILSRRKSDQESS